uniref:LIM zinc-binding domain-containing protein n=1 Tax=Acrobeloides nanus TaxID=290746 RepID=A0A914D7W6_9BILA
MQLQPLENSQLYVRRQERSRATSVVDEFEDFANTQCEYCGGFFTPGVPYVHVDGLRFHKDCFCCAQCFEPLLDQLFFNFEGRMYCSYDFERNYAPLCQNCKEYILGSVIKTLKGNYHPECLKCDECKEIIHNNLFFQGMDNLCEKCHATRPKYEKCVKCKVDIYPNEILWYREAYWHAFHFQCIKCEKELDSTAKVWKDKLYCLKCFNGIMFACSHCHQVINYLEEQSKIACGRHYHVNHLFCTRCGKNITDEHAEYDNKIFCKDCQKLVKGHQCFVCNEYKDGTIFVLGKNYCGNCYRCAHCDVKIKLKDKIINYDSHPICKKCFKRFPKEAQKRMYETVEK